MNMRGISKLVPWRFAFRGRGIRRPPEPRSGEPPVVPSGSLPDLDRVSQAFVALAECAGRAVVHVDTVERTEGRTLDDPPWSESSVRGSCSGSIVSPSGTILTSERILPEAGQFWATLPDGRSYRAEVCARDQDTDLAALRIKGSDLPWIPLELAREPRRGEVLLALGNPTGKAWSVRAGIVSAIHREVRVSPRPAVENVIEFSTPFQPISQGGPLIDARGRIVGIQTAREETPPGVGLAVLLRPSAWAVRHLTAGRTIPRPYLGVVGHNQLIDDPGCPSGGLRLGVVVLGVAQGSPAEAAGIRTFDVILEANNMPVQDLGELQDVVSRTPVGGRLGIKAMRGKRQITFEIRTSDRSVPPG